ncbi:MAG: LytTR family DNA-binding domain-containing protein [Sphingomonas sp.]
MRERPEDADRASRAAAGGRSEGARYRRALIIVACAALLMTILGPFGTAGAPLGTRLAYWTAVMAAGALMGIGASAGVRAWGVLSDHPVLEAVFISFLIALPLTATVSGLNATLFRVGAPTVQSFFTLFCSVLVVTGAIMAVNFTRAAPAAAAIESQALHAEETPVVLPPDDIPQPMPADAFLERLPQHMRGAELHALQAEDHYLRVHTSAGSALILLRLGDAMNEVSGIEGARVHRSWWVARTAVESARRLEGRAELSLPNGVTAPVSRSHMRVIQDLGWFD